MNWILHSKPWITEDDRNAVSSVLLSGMIGQGEKAREFEKEFSDWVGGTDGVATGSGAAALFLALQTLDVKGKEVILPTYVCESVLEAVLSSEAKPVLCDVGVNWVMEPGNIEKLVSGRTATIIVPHMYGIFADIKSFKRFNIPVIEDCAQAVGDKKIDAIEGDIAIFSFHPTKCLSTGEGGMLVSKNTAHIDKARAIRDGNKKHISARFLSPMSDIQASLGSSQLKRYPEFLKKRREIAGKYLTELAALNQLLVNYEAKASSMFFRVPIKINGGTEKYSAVFEKEQILIRKGVDKLLHRFLGLADKDFPVSVQLLDTTVSLPIYPAMTEEEIKRCIRSVNLLN